ncbi:IS607 family element RNA-guided endonuclease TnpB [Streptomyces sp. NPDC056656]|uniref:IS607 family element RNA-guided endonuclease TnpB n=1 Tax=Streptomyces sp. NPDC056656 TaxID=3345895 RepID=UPI003687BCED
MGIPRFKPKRKARLSCRFTAGTIRVDADGRHVTLHRLGTLRTHEPTVKLLARVQAGTARILSATVRHERGRWFVSFQTEVKRDLVRVARPGVAIGIDLGVKTLAVMADSAQEIREVADPRHLDTALKQLRRACRVVSRRQGPDRRTGQKPSKRWEKANAQRNKVHHRVANLREDALHKLTTSIAAEYGTIVVEDLNVAGMLRNRRLTRRIADAGFGEIRRQLGYKTRRRHGTRLVVADRWYPSSKTCSGCGAAKVKLPLHLRAYHCDACGLVLDRDDNAARNLAALAAAAVTGTGVAADQDTAPAASKPRGADRKTRATRPGRTAGTGRAGGATCRTNGRRKRETVLKPKHSRFGDVTDLPGRNARNAESYRGSEQRLVIGVVVLAASAHDNAAGGTVLLDQGAERWVVEQANGTLMPCRRPPVRPPARQLRLTRLRGRHREHGPPPHHAHPGLARHPPGDRVNSTEFLTALHAQQRDLTPPQPREMVGIASACARTIRF